MNIMKRAWQIRKEAARKFGCKISEIHFGLCLKQAWKESKMNLELSKMSNDEIAALIDAAKKELKERNTEQPKPINIFKDLQEKCGTDRYNGGWTKTVTDLNKTRTDGYSIKGEFIQGNINRLRIWDTGLYLDCDIRGSRKNQKRYYTLFLIRNNAVHIVAESEGRDWAVNLWEKIEENI